MDPVSQAVLGASLPSFFERNKQRLASALAVGALAGMAPDLDVLIQSDDDPLLFLEYHRQFTHSLLFIPIGALICALALYPFFKSRLTFKHTYLFAFAGYATHGLLDACTSYGTQLFWPFSDTRVAWSVVSIVDPLFTLPILVLLILAIKRRSRRPAMAAFVYAVVFLSLGIVQHQRAETALLQLAQQRGHQPQRIHVKPSFANRHLWKLMYEYDERYYVDAAKLLIDSTIIPGESIRKLDVQRDFPWLPADSQQAKDIERFRWFSDDYLAVNPENRNIIMDVRYSFIPNRIKLMWGIILDREKIENGDLDAHVGYEFKRGVDADTRKQFLQMLF